MVIATFVEILLEIKDEKFAEKARYSEKVKKEFEEISGVVNKSYVHEKEESNSESTIRKRISAKESVQTPVMKPCMQPVCKIFRNFVD